jgi:SAM-dependent methyltransferase
MLDTPPRAKGKANYGWDAPNIMLGMLALGLVLVAAGLALATLQPFPFSQAVGVVLIIAGAVPLLLGLAMLQYGVFGKLRTRDAILSLVNWRGDERVLDVGTGAGMLMIGAAKRLTRGGRAVGIDIWSAKDLSDNALDTTRRNIAIEAVADRTDVLTEDTTRLSFPDATFDVALSLLCLHNIEPKTDQAVACKEIARVVKPGGRVVIGDYVPTHAYAQALREAGLDVRRSSSAFGVAGALMWLVVADKPLGPARIQVTRSPATPSYAHPPQRRLAVDCQAW